jgi:hypothetical protein
MNETVSAAGRVVRILVIGLAIVGATYGWFAFKKWEANASVRNLNSEVDSLFEAFHKYKEIVGDYPRGDNAQIAKAILEGNNEKRVYLLVVRKDQLNAKGEIVDPWGTPLKIYFAKNEVLIRSAGPNKQFEDTKATLTDDYYRAD